MSVALCTSQANITILNVQQALDPVINVAQPLSDSDGNSAAASGAPPTGPGAAASGLNDSAVAASAAATGRRRLAGRSPFGEHGISGASSGRPLARRLLRAGRALQQAIPAAEMFAASDTPLQAVDVTMNLQGSSGEQVRRTSSYAVPETASQSFLQTPTWARTELGLHAMSAGEAPRHIAAGLTPFSNSVQRHGSSPEPLDMPLRRPCGLRATCSLWWPTARSCRRRWLRAASTPLRRSSCSPRPAEVPPLPCSCQSTDALASVMRIPERCLVHVALQCGLFRLSQGRCLHGVWTMSACVCSCGRSCPGLWPAMLLPRCRAVSGTSSTAGTAPTTSRGRTIPSDSVRMRWLCVYALLVCVTASRFVCNICRLLSCFMRQRGSA